MESNLSFDDVSFDDILDYVNSCVQDYAGRILNKIETDILRLTWEENLSYADMAVRLGYAPDTLKSVHGYRLWNLLKSVWPDEEKKVNKSRFPLVVNRRYADWLKSQQNKRLTPATLQTNSSFNHLSQRDTLASRLLESIESGYRSIVLTGAAGIGKTHLLNSLESELSSHFTHVVCYPTQELPSWKVWHRMLVPSAQIQDYDQQPTLAEYQLRQQVIQILNQADYLVIIDQSERFLDELQFNHFFSDISGAIRQKSCLLWSSDIIPTDFDQQIAALETVEGLSFDETKKLLIEQYPMLEASIGQNEDCWQRINDLCGGHPTLLYKAVDTIQSFFNDQIDQLIENLLPLSPSIGNYFDRIFSKLSEPEKVLLYWLALKPLSWLELQKWPLLLPCEKNHLMQGWDLLRRRHLIQKPSSNEDVWQVMPQYLSLYAIGKLQESLAQELLEDNLNLFHSYSIFLPQSSLEQQKILHRYLLKPLAAMLERQFSPEELQTKFNHLLDLISTFQAPSCSCAAGNLFNLAAYIGLSMADMNWHNLTLWHADLTVALNDIDFQQCQFRNAALPTGLNGQPVAALHPTGRTMAVGDEQGLVQVYKWTGNRFDLEWCYDLGLPIQEVIITDGDKLIVATMEQIQIWDEIATKEAPESIHLETATLNSMAVSPDGNRIAVGLSDSSIQLWNLAWGEKEGEPLSGADDTVEYIVFSPDGKSIAGYDNNNRIILWHQNPKGLYRVSAIPRPLDPYGSFLAFKWTDSQLCVVEMIPEMNLQQAFKVAIRTFVVTDEALIDDSIQFDVKELTRDPIRNDHAAFSSDGSYLAVCDVEQTIKVWCYTNPLQKRAVQLFSPPYALNICNGGRMLLCQNYHSVSLWELTQQRCIQMWDSVSDLDQYQNSRFYGDQGLSDDELLLLQRSGAIIG